MTDMTREEIEALVAELEEGVPACGMHDDGDTELFRIEDANDTMTEAASALRQTLARNAELEAALRALVDEYVDYQTINNLGDPEKQHNIRRARAALAPLPAAPGGQHDD